MDPKLQKILALALCPEAQEGEWHNAAVKFIQILRSQGTKAETLRIGNPQPSPSDWKTSWKPPTEKRKPAAPKPPPHPSTKGPYTERELQDALKAKMMFGIYKGVALKDIRLDYLEWAISTLDKISLYTKRQMEIVVSHRKRK